MNRLAAITITVVALAATLDCPAWAAAAPAAKPPADRVIAIYFHRTQRCPTCLKMGGYAEEAVKKGFAQQVKTGTVQFRYIDFEAKKNTALAKAYRINGPALVLIQVRQGKVKQYKNLKQIWTKVGRKPEFLRYVRENVQAYLDHLPKPTASGRSTR